MVLKATSRSSPGAPSATWGYELVREEFSDVAVGWDDCGGKPRQIMVSDNIATSPCSRCSPGPTSSTSSPPHLNGDYLSDALAAQVGYRIAPGANINYVTGPASSRRRTAPPPSTPARTRSIPARCSSRACSCSSTWGGGRGRTTSCGPRGDHRGQHRDLRLRPPDGRGDRGQDLRFASAIVDRSSFDRRRAPSSERGPSPGAPFRVASAQGVPKARPLGSPSPVTLCSRWSPRGCSAPCRHTRGRREGLDAVEVEVRTLVTVALVRRSGRRSRPGPRRWVRRAPDAVKARRPPSW